MKEELINLLKAEVEEFEENAKSGKYGYRDISHENQEAINATKGIIRVLEGRTW